MPNVTINNPIGLDAHIARLQKGVYNYLRAIWEVPEDMYNCYALCYRNRKAGAGYVPEVFVGGKDYKEVAHNDKVWAQSFFGVGDMIKTDARMQKAEVHFVIFVNLSKLKGIKDMPHRAANEAKLEVFKYFRKHLFGFQVTGQVTGIDKVLSEYPGVIKGNLPAKADMHPWHAFRFNLQCTYDPTASV